jgi:hypothetical protein
MWVGGGVGVAHLHCMFITNMTELVNSPLDAIDFLQSQWVSLLVLD